MTAAFNLRTARHLGGAHDDAEQISTEEPVVGRARRGDLGDALPAGQGPDAGRPAAGPQQRRRQGRAAPPPGRRPGRRTAGGAPGSCTTARTAASWTTRRSGCCLRLLTLATESRTVVAGRIGVRVRRERRPHDAPGPRRPGERVQTRGGVMHLPGVRLELTPQAALPRCGGTRPWRSSRLRGWPRERAQRRPQRTRARPPPPASRRATSAPTSRPRAWSSPTT